MTGAVLSRAELRLRVLNGLPQRHKDYFFEAARVACRKYIGSLGAQVNDRDTESLELFSEVMAKMLGASTRADRDSEPEMNEAGQGTPLPAMQEWVIDAAEPRRDSRVGWLMDEIGGARALGHRYEDMRRQRWGRWQESGYRTVQISALQPESAGEAVDEDQLLARVADGSVQTHADHDAISEADDMRMAWRGLLALSQKQFKPGDDVTLLLDVLATNEDVQASFGSEWPVRKIAQVLNGEFPERPWTDDRIDNAKRRLRNWIARLRQENGLDRTDLLALLVRAARQNHARATARDAAAGQAGGRHD